MTQKELKEAREKWEKHCEYIRSITDDTFVSESEDQKQKRVNRLLNNYNDFVSYYFPHYATCNCGDFQIKAANKVARTNNLKGLFMWPRGHAKSTHFDIIIPMWLKAKKLLNVMVLVGKSETSAKILLSDLQAEFEANQRYINDFGIQKQLGSWEDGTFITADNKAFFSLGRGQSPRGLRHREKRPDYIVIDDLDDDELSKNPSRVNKITEWVKEALFGALDGGKGRFIMVGNLISKNSVLFNLSQSLSVFVSKVKARMLDGTPLWKEKYSKEQLQEMEDFMGYRSFQKEMMHNPTSSGTIFKDEWIHWKRIPSLKKYDHIVAYCDPSFKSSKKNDFKAIKVWGRIGKELHHIKAFVRQASVAEMVRWFYDFHESLPENVICDYFIEANFLQSILMDDFEQEGELRGYQLPIRPDRRKKPDKFQRVESISPLWERGFVFYNEAMKKDNDMNVGLEQTLAFEKGTSAHDDGPDADEGAIYILQNRSRKTTETSKVAMGKRKRPSSAW